MCSRCYNLESDGIKNITEVKTDSGLIKLELLSIKLETNIEEKEKVDVNKENIKKKIDVDMSENVNIKKENTVRRVLHHDVLLDVCQDDHAHPDVKNQESLPQWSA